ncbi:MAG: D-glycero-alpha-D-manno-heptose-1,7-bisphosphate 7-phosphatase [Candidatus Aminicenantia bacterium]
MKRAVFLDRDGTLNEEKGGYIKSFEELKIFPFAFDAVKIINSLGFLAIVATNQAGISKGILKEEDVKNIHKLMEMEFEKKNARIDAFYYCPSHPDFSPQDANCRKPLIGMALKAKEDFGIELEKSYMIGDKTEDILFVKNFGGTGILVLTGDGKRSVNELEKMGVNPDFIAENVLSAVLWIKEKESLDE